MDVHEFGKRLKTLGFEVFYDAAENEYHSQCPCCQWYLSRGNREGEPLGFTVREYKGFVSAKCGWGCDKDRVRSLLGLKSEPGFKVDQAARCGRTPECWDKVGKDAPSPWVLSEGEVTAILDG